MVPFNLIFLRASFRRLLSCPLRARVSLQLLRVRGLLLNPLGYGDGLQRYGVRAGGAELSIGLWARVETGAVKAR